MYEATQETLRPLLSQAKGLDTDAKRFAFLLGILYGHLIYVQARKAEVNVSANALSWMRGGRLRPRSCPNSAGRSPTSSWNTTPWRSDGTANGRRSTHWRRNSPTW